jgi:hypothetical protein
MTFPRLSACRTLKILAPALFAQVGFLAAQTAPVVQSPEQSRAQSVYLNLPLSFERQGEGASER